MENQKREFTGIWIPRSVVEDERLNWTERAVYGEIGCYERCFMSNAFFARRIGVSERQVREILSKLKEFGYIQQTGFDGRHRFLSVQSGALPPGREEVNLHPERKPISMIDNSIDNNIDTSETKVSRVSDEEDTALIPVDDNGDPYTPRWGKKDTSYREVFELFGAYPKSWERNTTQIKAAKALKKERDWEQVKKAVQYYLDNSEKQFIPNVSTPYDLDTKWEKLLEYKYRDRR